MSDINAKYFSFAALFPSFVIGELLHDLDVTPKNVVDERNCLQSYNKLGYLASVSQQSAQLSLGIGSGVPGQRRKASVNVLELISLQRQIEGGNILCGFGQPHIATISLALRFLIYTLRSCENVSVRKRLILPSSLGSVGSFQCQSPRQMPGKS